LLGHWCLVIGHSRRVIGHSRFAIGHSCFVIRHLCSMPVKPIATLDVPSAAKWRSWLAKNHATATEIWLVFHKRHTGKPSIAYEDAVDEALCYGWIDSLIKRLDDNRYARKFTPRKLDSRWSTINRQRYARLKAAGRLKQPGLHRPPTTKSGDMPSPTSRLPPYIAQALKKNPAAQTFFQSLAPSHRRSYIAWIDSAKQQPTKLRRLEQALRLLAAHHKPGLK
jgi:uncharacterized protein YdeI (YjbR/CyaY-like superfamily)